MGALSERPSAVADGRSESAPTENGLIGSPKPESTPTKYVLSGSPKQESILTENGLTGSPKQENVSGGPLLQPFYFSGRNATSRM